VGPFRIWFYEGSLLRVNFSAVSDPALDGSEIDG